MSPAPPARPPPGEAEEPPFEITARERFRRLGERIWRTPGLLAGATLLGLFGAVSVASVLYYGSSLEQIPVNPVWANAAMAPGPSWGIWFGADSVLGISVFGALVRATPIDVALVGGILVGASALGIILGASAGLFGGAIDGVVTAFSDFLVGVPPFFLVLVLFLGIRPLLPLGSNGLAFFAVLFVFVLWPYYARPVRAVAQRARATPYAEAARAAGAGPSRLLFRHVVPNSIYPAFAQLPVDVYNVFFVLTVFPFLGCLGGGSNPVFRPIAIVPSPFFPEWGSLLGYGACFGWSILPSLNAWWSYAFPALVVIAFGFGVMLLADGLERFLSVEGNVR